MLGKSTVLGQLTSFSLKFLILTMFFIRKIKTWSKPHSFHWQNWFQSKLKSRLSIWITSNFLLSKRQPEIYCSQFHDLISQLKSMSALAWLTRSSMLTSIWKIFHFLGKLVLLLSFTLQFYVEESITFVSLEHRRIKKVWSSEFTIQIHHRKQSVLAGPY